MSFIEIPRGDLKPDRIRNILCRYFVSNVESVALQMSKFNDLRTLDRFVYSLKKPKDENLSFLFICTIFYLEDLLLMRI